MKITFLRDEIYETEGPNKGVEFPEGCVVLCTQEFGDRWLRRGAAEEIGAGEPKGGARWEIVSLPKAGEPKAAAPEGPKVLTPKSSRPPAKSNADREREAGAGDKAKTKGRSRGADTVTASGGADTVTSGSGADTVTTSGGADTVTSSGGSDSVSGGASQDQLNL